MFDTSDSSDNLAPENDEDQDSSSLGSAAGGRKQLSESETIGRLESYVHNRMSQLQEIDFQEFKEIDERLYNQAIDRQIEMTSKNESEDDAAEG